MKTRKYTMTSESYAFGAGPFAFSANRTLGLVAYAQGKWWMLTKLPRRWSPLRILKYRYFVRKIISETETCVSTALALTSYRHPSWILLDPNTVLYVSADHASAADTADLFESGTGRRKWIQERRKVPSVLLTQWFQSIAFSFRLVSQELPQSVWYQ